MTAEWTWNGQPLFSSGPHRVRLLQAGRLYLPPLTGDNPSAATLDLDVLERRYLQNGRLVADTDSSLWTLVDAVVNAAEDTQPGALQSPSGPSLTGLRMMRFLPGETVDRGRERSLPYEILYIRPAY